MFSSTIPSSGTCWPTTPNWPPTRWKRRCAIHRSDPAHCAPSPRTPSWRAILFPAGTLVIVNTLAANRDPSGLRRSRPFRHHAARRAGRPDVRRRHPLLPRREPGPAGARRGPADRDPPHDEALAQRTGAMETDDGIEWAEGAADRVLLCLAAVGRAIRLQRTRRRSTGSSMWPTPSSPNEDLLCASPMSHACWASPGRRSIGTSRAPKSWFWLAGCAPQTAFSTSSPSAPAA